MKHSQCSGLPEIYGQLEEGMGSVCTGICAFCFMCNIVCVVVFHRSTVNRRRGVESICHEYRCILLYMKLFRCNGFPEIYAPLEEGVGSICHGYM